MYTLTNARTNQIGIQTHINAHKSTQTHINTHKCTQMYTNAYTNVYKRVQTGTPEGYQV